MNSINGFEHGFFSASFEHSLLLNFNKNFERMWQAHEKLKFSFELVTQKEVLEKFDISPATLLDWETHGLKRYSPPIEGTRKVYYKTTEIIAFLGAA